MTIPLGNLILSAFLTSYVVHLITVRSKKGKAVNQELETLRAIPVKSIEQQKRFLELKNPPRQKEKWFYKTLWRWIKTIGLNISVFYGFYRLFREVAIGIPQSLLCVFIGSLVFDWVLSHWGLEMTDLFRLIKKW